MSNEKPVALEPFGYFKAEPFGWRDCAETDEWAIALYEAPQPQAVDQAPVAWRYQTPTGWHATTDAAAANRVSAHHPIEPLYAAPQPQADARDAERWSEIGKSIERACGELPEDFEITIHLENGAGTVALLYPNGEECENFPHDDGFAGVVNAAIDAAIAAAKESK